MEPALNAPLVSCPVRGLCSTKSFLAMDPGVLSVLGSSVIAYRWQPTDAFLSSDGGASFRHVALPGSVATVLSMVLVGPDMEIWVSATATNGSDNVYRLTQGGWSDVSIGDPLVHTRAGTLFAVGPDEVLDALSDAGYRCTLATVVRWLPRCP